MTVTVDDRPSPVADREASTVPQLLTQRAARLGDEVAFRHKHLGIWSPVTWRSYGAHVEAIALGLAEFGVTRGDRVAIQSENRPEWVYADIGVESLGAVAVGVYPTNPAAELRYLLRNSGARVIVAEDQEQVDKALAVFDDCPDLEHIVVIDPKGLRRYDHPALITYADVEAKGRAATAALPERFAQLVAATDPDDVACIVYTSGTTGPPKGAMLTHRQTLSAAAAFAAALGVDAADTHVSYLPLCHMAERAWTLYIALLVGCTVNFAESVDTVQRDIHEIAPTFFGAVPRIAEKMQASVEINMQDAAWIKRRNYQLWMRIGRRLGRRRVANRGRLPIAGRMLYAVGSILLYRPLRTRLGLRRVRHCVVGAAAVAPDLLEYYHAIGVRMIQVFGQTECGGVSHMHHGWDIRYDTVGTTVGDFECRLAVDSGEILLRGAGLFEGYWRDEAATAAAIDMDGWLHTGDVGELDPDGHLRVVGRIKDIIITAGGKNVSPQEIENRLRFSPFVREAIVIGDGRKYLGALIGIEFDTVAHWAERQGIAYTTYGDLSRRPEIVDLIGGWVTEVNSDLAQVETIKRFRLLPKELDHDDDELTATQKVRRATIAAKFSPLVEELYR